MPIGRALFNGTQIQPKNSNNPIQASLPRLSTYYPMLRTISNLNNQAFVVRVMREFLLGKVGP